MNVESETRTTASTASLPDASPTNGQANGTAPPGGLVQLELKRRELGERHGISYDPIEHFRRPVEHVFTEDQRANTTVLLGGLSPRHDRLVEASLRRLGYDCRALPNVSIDGYERAKQYGNNGQCNPTYFTVGNLVKYVEDLEESGMSRQDIIDKHVFVTAGSCGTCRFGMYESEYRLALQNAGFDGFRILLFGMDDGIDQSTGQKSGLDMNLDFFLGLVSAFNMADVINQFQYKVKAYEREPGSVDAATQKVIGRLADFIEGNRPFEVKDSRLGFLEGTRLESTANYLGKFIQMLGGKDVPNAMQEAFRIYDEVEVDNFRVRPIVKMIGEFWAQSTEGAGNFHMHQFLVKEGAEVYADRSLFTRLTYMLFMHKQSTRDKKGIRKNGEGKLEHLYKYYRKQGMLTLAEKILKRENDRLLVATDNVLHEMCDQYEMEKLARPFWNWRTMSGEGHLEIAENIYYHRNHLTHMVLSLKPFTCMPSSQSDGAQARVVETFPGMIFLPIETSGDGEVIAHSRVQMALGSARVKARQEFADCLDRTGKSLDDLKAYVEDHPRMKRATYRIPHYHGVTGRAANFVLHVSDLMDGKPEPAHA